MTRWTRRVLPWLVGLLAAACARDDSAATAAKGTAAEAEVIRRAEASIAAAERAERDSPPAVPDFPAAPAPEREGQR